MSSQETYIRRISAITEHEKPHFPISEGPFSDLYWDKPYCAQAKILRVLANSPGLLISNALLLDKANVVSLESLRVHLHSLRRALSSHANSLKVNIYTLVGRGFVLAESLESGSEIQIERSDWKHPRLGGSNDLFAATLPAVTKGSVTHKNYLDIIDPTPEKILRELCLSENGYASIEQLCNFISEESRNPAGAVREHIKVLNDKLEKVNIQTSVKNDRSEGYYLSLE